MEKVVLAQPEPKRSLGDVQTALEIMQTELQEMVAYLERDDAELEIVDQIQRLLNIAAAEPIESLIRGANDNAVQVILGELVKVAVLVKKNQLAEKK